MKKHTRAGGKFCGTHGTCAEGTEKVADIAHACPFVERIRLGFIAPKLKPAKGLLRVKMRNEEGCLLLKVRAQSASQEMWLYVSMITEAKLWLENKIKKAGYEVSFMENATG